MIREQTIKTTNVIGISLLHFFALISLVNFIFNFNTRLFLWSGLIGGIGGFGVTAGAHRLWSHRAYKAKTVMKILLALCFSVAGQNTIFDWVRDHRLHHKYSETDADPHNSRRGFFFSHVGWLMMTKHKDVIEKGRKIYLLDIEEDSVVKIHTRFFTVLKTLLCFLLPTVIPIFLWDESVMNSIHSQILRYTLGLNFTWLVNSAAHMWGNRPYDKNIPPRQNTLVSILAMGEGYHNYHHVFPWDYKAAELGIFNVTTFLLKFFKSIGWIYDVREPSKNLIKSKLNGSKQEL